MKMILASAAVAAAVLGTAAPASAQFYAEPFVGPPYYAPGYPGYYWGGPRVYVVPRPYAVVPAYRYGPVWGGPRWGYWD
ncbi:MAG TPA: hypothetical protein VGX95_10710 [Xanthobacteraceae bacterium]|jgi:hypothetical protein|nr:hypothetical protein [Xanthobacteraceae bacterium]